MHPLTASCFWPGVLVLVVVFLVEGGRQVTCGRPSLQGARSSLWRGAGVQLGQFSFLLRVTADDRNGNLPLLWSLTRFAAGLFSVYTGGFAKSGRQETRLEEVLEDAEVPGVESSSSSWSRWWRLLESRCLGGLSEAVLYSDLSQRLSLLCTFLRFYDGVYEILVNRLFRWVCSQFLLPCSWPIGRWKPLGYAGESWMPGREWPSLEWARRHWRLLWTGPPCCRPYESPWWRQGCRLYRRVMTVPVFVVQTSECGHYKGTESFEFVNTVPLERLVCSQLSLRVEVISDMAIFGRLNHSEFQCFNRVRILSLGKSSNASP